MTAIVLTADENYLRYLPSLFAQIALFGRRADGVTLAVPGTIGAHQLRAVRAAAAIHEIALTVVPVSESDDGQITRFAPIREGNHWSYFTYARLLLPDMLPELDDVLYLDVDTMIRAPIDELLQWDLFHPIGAVQELAGTGAHLFGTPRAPYFNAGVLRMSLERMRREKLWERSLRILEARSEVKWFDQDVLNLAFHDRFDSLPLTYNVSDMVVRKHPGLSVLEDPVIVHFNGLVKPWHPSAASPYAREWRRRNAQAISAARIGEASLGERNSALDPPGRLAAYRRDRRAGRSHSHSLVRAVVPAEARRAAKGAATVLVDRALARLEEISVGLQSPRLPTKTHPPQKSVLLSAPRTNVEDGTTDYGLDLLISVARSGTNALGDAVRRTRPDVRWMNELYLGAGWSDLVDEEIIERFPWFSDGSPEAISDLPPQERPSAFESFAATVSGQAVELTRAILEKSSGRTLIKIFPDQLHPSAFEELLRVFRPRLLVLRRELIFTYVSRLRAMQLDHREKRFGTAWFGSDLTEVPYEMDERTALQYALRCDSWFDRLDQLALKFGLSNAWITYTGLFVTGADIPTLESFYPGSALPTDAKSGGLQSGLAVQDRRSDPSVLEMLKAVSTLSAATQAHLLRLPGHRRDHA